MSKVVVKFTVKLDGNTIAILAEGRPYSGLEGRVRARAKKLGINQPVIVHEGMYTILKLLSVTDSEGGTLSGMDYRRIEKRVLYRTYKAKFE